mmetsp:Transcript_14245/g.33718  ORF Transcript_14245/g.33718 Transcript_14245/m.33718 type:complete len:369 (-) Transcript_14245:58-1164(-)
MGGAVSVGAPVSASVEAVLKAEYDKRVAAGASEEDLDKLMKTSLPSVIVFNQIDMDHSGSVDAAELKRALIALPRNGRHVGDGKDPPFVPFEGMVATLDSDSSGEISLSEWIENLGKLPDLQKAIEASVDPRTGKLAKYRSLEEQLALRMQQRDDCEARAQKGEDVETELEKRHKQVALLQSQLGLAGVIVFNQLDLDGSGKLEREELLRAIKHMCKSSDQAADLNEEELTTLTEGYIKLIDVDGDGIIDMDEWLFRLDRAPRFQEMVEEGVDGVTGKIRGYRTLPEQLAKLEKNIADLEAQASAGEDVGTELERRNTQRDKCAARLAEVEATRAAAEAENKKVMDEVEAKMAAVTAESEAPAPARSE